MTGLAVAGLFVLAWWGVGELVVRALRTADHYIGRGPLAMATGMALHSVWTSTALLLHVRPLFATAAFLAIGGTGVVLCRRRLGVGVRRALWRIRRTGRSTGALTAAAVAVVALLVVGSTAPPVSHDALFSHLPHVRSMLTNADLAPLLGDFMSYVPRGAHVLYVAAASLGDVGDAQAVHAACGALLAFAAWRIAVGLRMGTALAAVTVCLLLTLSDFVGQMPTANHDLVFGALQIAGVSQLATAWRRRSTGGVVLCGLLLGVAVSVKLLGAILVALAVLAVALSARPLRRPLRALALAALLGATALLAYSPWIVRGARHLDAPLFPLQQARPPGVEFATTTSMHDVGSGLDAIGDAYPVRRTPTPLMLTALAFEPQYRKDPLPPVFVGLLPLGLLVVFRRRGLRRRLSFVTGLVVLDAAMSFHAYPLVRYALAAWAVLACVAALGAVVVWRWGRLARIVVVLAVGPPLAIGVADGLLDATRLAMVASQPARHDAYVAGVVRPYGFFRDVRDQISGRVLSFDRRLFYIGGEAEHADLWNPFWSTPRSTTEWQEVLDRRDYRFVLHVKTTASTLRVPEQRKLLRAVPGVTVAFDDERGTLYRYDRP